MKCQIDPYLLASKGEKAEAKPAGHGGGPGTDGKEVMMREPNKGKRSNRKDVQNFDVNKKEKRKVVCFGKFG